MNSSWKECRRKEGKREKGKEEKKERKKEKKREKDKRKGGRKGKGKGERGGRKKRKKKRRLDRANGINHAIFVSLLIPKGLPVAYSHLYLHFLVLTLAYHNYSMFACQILLIYKMGIIII